MHTPETSFSAFKQSADEKHSGCAALRPAATAAELEAVGEYRIRGSHITTEGVSLPTARVSSSIPSASFTLYDTVRAVKVGTAMPHAEIEGSDTPSPSAREVLSSGNRPRGDAAYTERRASRTAASWISTPPRGRHTLAASGSGVVGVIIRQQAVPLSATSPYEQSVKSVSYLACQKIAEVRFNVGFIPQ